MAYDVDDIAAAIAASLAGLTADGVGVQALDAVPANPTPSGVYVEDGEFDYDLTMHRGLDKFTMIVTLLVGYNADLASQRRLRKLRGSVKGLIEADKTLGGRVDHARVTKASRPTLYGRESGKPVLGCEFTVQIYATP